MKTIIIDANNVIHKDIQLKALFIKDKESAQLALVEKVKAGLNRDEKVFFVFDGHGKSGDNSVEYSGNKTADEIIRKRIETFKDVKKLTIVSSDNGITGLARVCGCKVKSSENFLNDLSKKQNVTSGKNINQNYLYDLNEKPDSMNKKEIEEFKKYFT
ncbi:MAG TPA: NYN domain-containing protein [Ignavibacteria bacterium]|nr:NYN domain-containing protein [Ignavibacteria bacterium]